MSTPPTTPPAIESAESGPGMSAAPAAGPPAAPWSDLVSAALLGTARRRPPVPVLHGDVAAQGVARRAGARAA
ncbi:hypothetical protein ACFQLX_04425, partial [Streptomyces polyrhachis]